MTHTLATIGTDGTRDWVRLPSGRTFTTGHLPMAVVVGTLATSVRAARIALDDLVAGRETVLSIDEGRLPELFQPRRFRLAHGSLIAPLYQGPLMDDSRIASLTTAVLAAQKALRDLSQAAAESAGQSTAEAKAVKLAAAQQRFSGQLKQLSLLVLGADQPAPQVSQEALKFKLAKSLTRIAALQEHLQSGGSVEAKLAAGRLVTRIASAASSGQPLSESLVTKLAESTDQLYGRLSPRG